MKEIIIVGAGGHAAEIEEYIMFTNKSMGEKGFSIAAFLDDNPENYSRYKFKAPLLGEIKKHSVLTNCYYIIAIADVPVRKFIATSFREKGARFLTFVDPRAYVSESASIGEGCIIGPYVNVGPNVSLGLFNLVNSRASLGHDSKIGNFNIISPNVCFSGSTQIGDENLFGINSVTIPGISIGNRNKIMAGMVLDQNIGNETVVFYRFRERVFAFPKSG